jgi:hypothetical protein
MKKTKYLEGTILDDREGWIKIINIEGSHIWFLKAICKYGDDYRWELETYRCLLQKPALSKRRVVGWEEVTQEEHKALKSFEKMTDAYNYKVANLSNSLVDSLVARRRAAGKK